jgi:hypothetical protein
MFVSHRGWHDAFPPLHPRREVTKGRTNHKSRHPLIDLLLRAKAWGCPRKSHKKAPTVWRKIKRNLPKNKSPRKSQPLLWGIGGYTLQVRSCAPIEKQAHPISQKAACSRASSSEREMALNHFLYFGAWWPSQPFGLTSLPSLWFTGL